MTAKWSWAFLVLLPQILWAQAQVYPTRITLTEEAPSSHLTLKNPTEKIQRFRIEFAQFLMLNDGRLDKAKSINSPLVDLVKFSPKTVQIDAGDKQVVRVMATSLEELEPGDYVIHLRFVPDSDNDAQPGNTGQLSLQGRIAVAVPIIVRRGKFKIEPKLSELKALESKNGNLEISMKISNPTSYIVTGDLELKAILDNREEVLLKKTSGLSSYLPQRDFKTEFDQEELANLLKGKKLTKLKVHYFSNSETGGDYNLISETSIQTPPEPKPQRHSANLLRQGSKKAPTGKRL